MRALPTRRRGRSHALRPRVAAGVPTTFVALWVVLFVQLARPA